MNRVKIIGFFEGSSTVDAVANSRSNKNIIFIGNWGSSRYSRELKIKSVWTFQALLDTF